MPKNDATVKIYLFLAFCSFAESADNQLRITRPVIFMALQSVFEVSYRTSLLLPEKDLFLPVQNSVNELDPQN